METAPRAPGTLPEVVARLRRATDPALRESLFGAERPSLIEPLFSAPLVGTVEDDGRFRVRRPSWMPVARPEWVGRIVAGDGGCSLEGEVRVPLWELSMARFAQVWCLLFPVAVWLIDQHYGVVRDDWWGVAILAPVGVVGSQIALWRVNAAADRLVETVVRLAEAPDRT